MEALEALCLAAPFDLTVEAAADWQGAGKAEALRIGRMWLKKEAPAKSSALVPRPLPELIWYAALRTSRGQLLQGCRADEPERLKRWPDFALLHPKESHVALGALMTEDSADLLTVAEATGVALGEVFDFHNACAAVGLIEHTRTESLRKRPLAEGEREMYRRIPLALEGLKAGLHVEQSA